MNLIADAMEPYLLSSGIAFTRNDPEQTLSQVIAQSNAGDYDLHLALHSNAAGAANSGQVRGTDVYYYTNSTEGKQAADIIAENFKNIYPDPSRVRTLATSSLAEVVRTRAPSVLLETAYHDNVEDAEWIRDNINAIARNLVQSLTQYFGIPFVEAQPAREGRVDTVRGDLNLRSRPSMDASIITTIPDGSAVTIYGELPDWYVVNYLGNIGYASRRYIQV